MKEFSESFNFFGIEKNLGVENPKRNLLNPNLYAYLRERSSMSDEIEDQLPPWVRTFKELKKEVKKNSK